ncbi:xanthine dehydrogenase accessory protein XdhC [Rhodobacterales bacterium]|nr:xanthine dehydrogenase accessory protein XdhC [Rhodobacterales bacterium]
MKVWAHIADTLRAGGSCALVTVARADGSTPREAGARMVVRSDGSFFGTIGGGTLELEAIRGAARMASVDQPIFQTKTVSLGPDLGQCCGGRVDIATEVFTQGSLSAVSRLSELETTGQPFGTSCTVQGENPSQREVLDRLPSQAFAIAPETSDRQTVIERFGKTARPIFLFGAGHVGKALVLALAPLPFAVTWIDSRADQFPAAVPAGTTKVSVNDPAQLLEKAPDGAFVLAMTHSHALDEDIMARALLQQRFEYCGVIGSATKRARFQKRLRARGLNEALIAKMACPIGVDTLKSKQPAAIAAGVAVDLLMRDEARHQQATAGEGLAQIIPHGQ